MRFLLIVAVLFVLTSSTYAALEEESLHVFAITDAGAALTADLTLRLTPGTGKIYTTVQPLVGTSTQTTEVIAIDVAKTFSNEVGQFNYYFDIQSDASLVEGPSAGAAMTLLAVAMLQDREIPDTVGITGTITEEGFVGNVGGVFEKAREAARIGIKIFMVPPGENQQIIREEGTVESINLSSYAQERWGMKVVEVSTIEDVLNFAFQDPDTIDITAQGQDVPDFIPLPIQSASSLFQMESITRELVEEANQEVKKARTALATTFLHEPRTINTLLNALNSAETDVKQANLLLDQNYLFSAANFAFLAKVNAGLVNDISARPEILDFDSPVFEVKVFNLKKRSLVLQEDLNAFISIENIEWHIGAQQRVSWATLKLNALESTIPLVIGEDADAILITRVHDLHFAQAWLDVAEDFYEVSKASPKKAIPRDFFGSDFEEYVHNAQQGLEEFENGDSEQAQEKIDAAIIKGNWGWYEAGSFDAVFSYSLSQGSQYVRGKDVAEMRAFLLDEIVTLDGKVAASPHDFVWTQLYLDHARYFSKAIDHYEEHGQISLAADSARNGITLLFLAQNLFDITTKIKEHYTAIPDDQLFNGAIPNRPAPLPFAEDENEFYFTIIIGVVVGFFFLALGSLLFHRRSSRGAVLSDKLSGLSEQRKVLDFQFQHHTISESEFLRRKKAIDDRVHLLVYRKEKVSSETVQVDKLESRVEGDKRVLRKIEQQRSQGKILQKDFDSTHIQMEAQITKLKSEIRKHKKTIGELSVKKKTGHKKRTKSKK
jgi:uncharacterized protein